MHIPIQIIFLVGLALSFDFLNGFHDSANAIATIVSTRVLSPRLAVVWAAVFEFSAFFFFGLHVANTIGKGIIDIHVVDQTFVFGALIGACGWDLITWYFGLPTSSSHALIGGMIGAALVKAGPQCPIDTRHFQGYLIYFPGSLNGIGLGSFLRDPCAYDLSKIHSPQNRSNISKGQLFSTAIYCMGHGGNDAQKTMGIIASLLFSAGLLGDKFYIPFWVVLACYSTLTLGIICGGWRIVKTMGQKIVKLRPIDGFCAESGAGTLLYLASALGIPVSTTHTITGGIMGVGALKRFSAVKWGVARRIVWAWIITIPCSAVFAAIAYGDSPLFPNF